MQVSLINSSFGTYSVREVNQVETVILKTFEDDLTAVIDYCVNSSVMKISYNIKTKAQGIYKLLVFSSFKPACEPLVADTLEFLHQCAHSAREITTSEAAYKGYYLNDLDTFALVVKDPDGFRCVGVHFCRLAWDLSNNAFFIPKSRPDESIERAKKALNSIKDLSTEEIYNEYIGRLKYFETVFKKTSLVPLESFDWYEVPDKTAICSITSYRHALAELSSNTPFLWGVGKDGITALAVKNDLNFTFSNVSDCVQLTGGYYIVGVLFSKDGQYFAKIK